MKTLLVAVQEEDQELVSDVAAGEFDMVVVTSLPEARKALLGSIDAIACGVHFNEGNMLSFLDDVRANPKTENTPFLCVKGSDGRLHPASYVATKVICGQRDVEFIDVPQMIKQFGREHAYGEVRKRLHDILAEPSRDEGGTTPLAGTDYKHSETPSQSPPSLT